MAATPVQAAVLTESSLPSRFAGFPLHQQFLPSGASVVTTRDGKSCVVSRRLEIETSLYRDRDGSDIPFDQILRSPAASIQAISTVPGKASFRLQLKYSVARGTPILLTLEDEELDLQSTLEKSTDSLFLEGALAARLQAAFLAGIMPGLSSVSIDTGHVVTDRLGAPELAALDACMADLPVDRTVAAEVDNTPRVNFRADPETTPLATLPQLRACRMMDEPGDLHLARIETVNGFFAQTDKVFVSFKADGTLARAYIPGVFDGDFSGGAPSARLSRAADANVPTMPNDVKGCLGSAAVRMCSYGPEEGRFRLGPCLDGFPDATGYVPELALLDDPVDGETRRPGMGTKGSVRNNDRAPTGRVTERPTTGTSIGVTTPTVPRVPTVPPFIPKGNEPNFDTGTSLEITPVPLPASLVILLGALMTLRRRPAR